MRNRGYQFRNIVLTLVERGGPARSFHIEGTTAATLIPILRANINRESTLMTDEASWYRAVGRDYANHLAVNHGEKVYSVGDITTNTVEGYFSIFKRGMKGVYQHCAESTCTGIWLSLISVTATVLRLALMIQCARPSRYKELSEND